jgi:hypothetical protein
MRWRVQQRLNEYVANTSSFSEVLQYGFLSPRDILRKCLISLLSFYEILFEFLLQIRCIPQFFDLTLLIHQAAKGMICVQIPTPLFALVAAAGQTNAVNLRQTF